jgi:signal transduction histidine kinase
MIRSARHARLSQYKVRELLGEREALVGQLQSEVGLKNTFIATLAHELRNPLAPIRTGLGILRLSQTQKPPIQILDMMERQVSHLVRLIDDLLDISRITLGKLELRKQRVPLDVLLSSAVEAGKSLIEAKGHTFTTSVPDEPITLEVDPVRMAQVITNLLSNAARYTPDGGVITLTVRRKDATIRIEVTDNGIGLSPEMLNKVFEMFSQANSSMASSQGGLGIGLTLARRLTEMHNGTLEASSPGPGEGSTFTVILPLESSAQPAAGGPPS